MAETEYNELNDGQEVLVREYLCAQLDKQIGRAEARFRRSLNEQRPAPSRARIFRLPNRPGGWTMGIIGAALAASLAALWAGPSLDPVMPPAHIQIPVQAPATAVNNMLIEQDVRSQTFDDGVFMTDDNTVVRVLRRRDLERTRWFDQDKKLQREQVVPQDHVVYVRMKTY